MSLRQSWLPFDQAAGVKPREGRNVYSNVRLSDLMRSFRSATRCAPCSLMSLLWHRSINISLPTERNRELAPVGSDFWGKASSSWTTDGLHPSTVVGVEKQGSAGDSQNGEGVGVGLALAAANPGPILSSSPSSVPF